MRKLLVAIALSFCASHAHAGDEAWQLGNFSVLCTSTVFTTIAAASVGCWIHQPILPGETVIGIMGSNGSATMNTPTDPSGNQWVVDANAASGVVASVFVAHLNAQFLVNYGSTYTFTQSATAGTRAMIVAKFSGIYSAVVDTVTQGNGATAAWATATVKGTQADGILVGGSLNAAAGVCTASTPAGGQTELGDLNNADNDCLVAQFLPVTAPGSNSLSGTWGGAGTTRNVAVQYKAGGRRID